jgi:hypothetical protein
MVDESLAAWVFVGIVAVGLLIAAFLDRHEEDARDEEA